MLGGSVAAARAVVSLPETLSQASKRSLSSVEDGNKVRLKMVKQILDTNTVITMQVARACAERKRRRHALKTPTEAQNKRLHCMTLLLQESTSNLFFGHANMRHMGAASSVDPRWMDISPLNMSPLFASGELLAMTCFDRFAVEALFTPQVVPLIRMLIFGDRSLDDSEHTPGNRLQQISSPEHLVGQTWGRLVQHFLSAGRMPLGILRLPEFGTTFRPGDFVEDCTLPYVMANPEPDVVMRRSDLVFIVGPSHSSEGLANRTPGRATSLRAPRVSLSEEVQLKRAGTLSAHAMAFVARTPSTKAQPVSSQSSDEKEQLSPKERLSPRGPYSAAKRFIRRVRSGETSKSVSMSHELSV
jgi:hypothetical protein